MFLFNVTKFSLLNAKCSSTGSGMGMSSNLPWKWWDTHVAWGAPFSTFALYHTSVSYVWTKGKTPFRIVMVPLEKAHS